jgi:hypothetical protein
MSNDSRMSRDDQQVTAMSIARHIDRVQSSLDIL